MPHATSAIDWRRQVASCTLQKYAPSEILKKLSAVVAVVVDTAASSATYDLQWPRPRELKWRPHCAEIVADRSKKYVDWLNWTTIWTLNRRQSFSLHTHTLSLSLCLWLRTMTTTTTNLGQREWKRKRGRKGVREGEWGQTSSSRSPSLLWAFDFKCQRCLGKLVNELTTTTNWNKIDKTRTTTTTTTSSGCSSAAQLSASFDSLRQPVVALPLSLTLSPSVTPLLRSQCCRR